MSHRPTAPEPVSESGGGSSRCQQPLPWVPCSGPGGIPHCHPPCQGCPPFLSRGHCQASFLLQPPSRPSPHNVTGSSLTFSSLHTCSLSITSAFKVKAELYLFLNRPQSGIKLSNSCFQSPRFLYCHIYECNSTLSKSSFSPRLSCFC